MVWEIFTEGTVPYVGMSNKEVIDKVISGYRLEKLEKCPQEVYDIILKCWNVEPKSR